MNEFTMLLPFATFFQYGSIPVVVNIMHSYACQFEWPRILGPVPHARGAVLIA